MRNPHWISYAVKKIFTALALTLDDGKTGIKMIAQNFSVTVYFIKYLDSFTHRQVNYVSITHNPMIFIRCIYNHIDDTVGAIYMPGKSDDMLKLVMRIFKSTYPFILPSLLDELDESLSVEQKTADKAFTSFFFPRKEIEDPLDNHLVKPCCHCGKKRAGTCVRCHSVRYCSKFCQEQDWPRHKVVCF